MFVCTVCHILLVHDIGGKAHGEDGGEMNEPP